MQKLNKYALYTLLVLNRKKMSTVEGSPLPERVQPWTEEEKQAEIAAILRQAKILEKKEAKKEEQQAKRDSMWTTVGKKKKRSTTGK